MNAQNSQEETLLIDKEQNAEQIEREVNLTNFNTKNLRYESLEDRIIYAKTNTTNHIVNSGINPLVASLAPLIYKVISIQNNEDHMDNETLKDYLVSNIKLFEVNAIAESIDNTQIMIARYIICTVLDEAVMSCNSIDKESWSSNSLLSIFHNETYGGEKFFTLLDKILRNPVGYLYILELMFICLGLGFKGKYRLNINGTLELDSIRDGIYQQIRLVRGELRLNLSDKLHKNPVKEYKIYKKTAFLTISLFTIFFIALSYISFSFIINRETSNVLHLLSRQTENATIANKKVIYT